MESIYASCSVYPFLVSLFTSTQQGQKSAAKEWLYCLQRQWRRQGDFTTNLFVSCIARENNSLVSIPEGSENQPGKLPRFWKDYEKCNFILRHCRLVTLFERTHSIWHKRITRFQNVRYNSPILLLNLHWSCFCIYCCCIMANEQLDNQSIPLLPALFPKWLFQQVYEEQPPQKLPLTDFPYTAEFHSSKNLFSVLLQYASKMDPSSESGPRLKSPSLNILET